jgi:2-oxoglutarate dehydrogenase E2 component (dihydrolipoamide succinyltransferase)
MADITMPQLGETVTEGTITKWHKAVGDEVKEDELLYEVSTDKVDTEVTAPTSGVLTEILVQEGDTVDVGTKLATIGDAASAPADPPAADPAADAAPAAEAPPVEAPADAAASPDEVTAAPGAEPAAPEPVAAPAPPAPSAPPEAPAPAPAPTANGGGGKLLSPVVRRLISEHGLDPERITGTGAGGRITREDVLKVVESGGAQAVPAPAAAPAAASAGAATAAPAAAPAARPAPPAIVAKPGERDTAIPHSNMRKRTAEHMVRSKATSAHVYASIEVDYEGVERVRRAHKAEWKASEGFSLTYLPFISRAVIDAIGEYPEVNASFGETDLIVHHYIGLGIAVDMDFKGLMVPVVQDADAKRLRAVAREISELAAKTRSKKLSPDEITGGTFTITNPGPFGTTMTLPIINQPQVAILSTDGVKRRPVVVEGADGSEGIAIHSVGNLTLTWDHRAFDGAYAASFLNRIREIIETRDWSAEL